MLDVFANHEAEGEIEITVEETRCEKNEKKIEVLVQGDGRKGER